MSRQRTDSDRKSDKKYSNKTIVFAAKYTPTDIDEGHRLKSYLKQTNQSANSYIKRLIKDDLDKKGFAI